MDRQTRTDNLGSGSEDVANTDGGRSHEPNNEIQTGRNITGSSSEDVANAESHRWNSKTQSEMDEKENRRKKRCRFDDSSEDVADTNLNREKWNQPEDGQRSRTQQGSEDVADTESSIGYDNETITGDGEPTTQEVSGDGSSVRGESAWWDFEPDVGRVAHGIPGRVYRLKGLGNSIVPQIAQEIGNAIIKAEREK